MSPGVLGSDNKRPDTVHNHKKREPQRFLRVRGPELLLELGNVRREQRRRSVEAKVEQHDIDPEHELGQRGLVSGYIGVIGA